MSAASTRSGDANRRTRSSAGREAVLQSLRCSVHSCRTSLHGFGIAAGAGSRGARRAPRPGHSRLAFARRASMDERERALRDLAYRRGFRLLGLAVLVDVVVLIASAFLVAILVPGDSGFGSSAVNNGVSGRGLLVLAQLVLMTPTMVIAWVSMDVEEDEVSRGGGRGLVRAALALPALAGAWLALALLAPDQVVTASNASAQASVQGATCLYFATGRMTGAEFGATVGMRVDVCWNGHDAFVFGNPRIPLPQSAVDAMEANIPPADRLPASDVNSFNVEMPQVSGCGLDNTEDFATVSSTTCTGGHRRPRHPPLLRARGGVGSVRHRPARRDADPGRRPVRESVAAALTVPAGGYRRYGGVPKRGTAVLRSLPRVSA